MDMGAENGPVFVGIDLTDLYAERRRPCKRAVLTPSFRCTFDGWWSDESDGGMVTSSVGEAGFVLAVDGPQGLAGSADRTMRACERQLGADGKSPYGFPSLGRPFAGFVTGSVRLFHAMYESGKYHLYGAPGVERSRANLIEVYPGAAWRALAGKQRLQKKTLRAGREARFSLLQKHGLTFPGLATPVLPTHDELDAALAAYIAYLFVDGKTTDTGEPPFEDVGLKVLREGFIVQPSGQGEMKNLKPNLLNIYRRIKKNCSPEWQTDAQKFYKWYDAQFKKQNQCCNYCHLPGDTEKRYGKWFRVGRRGHRLEVDRIESKEPYSPENCVLACYPCNNAKSDVFSYTEFLEIGKAIRRVKMQRVKDSGKVVEATACK